MTTCHARINRPRPSRATDRIQQLIDQENRTRIEGIVRHQLDTRDYDACDTLTRFSYLGDGARDFLDLTRSPGYTSYQREIRLIERMMQSLESTACGRTLSGPLHVVDLGCGDGIKSGIFLERLALNDPSGRQGNRLFYTALDMSPEMLSIAERNHSLSNARIMDGRRRTDRERNDGAARAGQGPTREYRLCDFTNQSDLSYALHGQPGQELTIIEERLFLLLGNTLANEADMTRQLSQIRQTAEESGTSHSRMLLGIELYHLDIAGIVQEYDNEANRRLTVRPLQPLGIRPTDGRAEIGFEERADGTRSIGGEIREYFEFTHQTPVYLPGAPRVLEAGERILLSRTHKPTEDQMLRIIADAGWELRGMMREGNQALMMIEEPAD